MQLPRKETIEALTPVKAAIASKDEAGLKTCIWLDGEYAFATDGALGVKVKFSSPIKCGVPGALFFGLLNQISADTLNFDYSENTIKLKAGRSSMKVPTLPLESGEKIWRFPAPSTKKPLASIEITQDFIDGLTRVLALKPGKKEHMEHHAVCIFDVDGKEMDLYTTDYPRSLVVMGVSEKITGSAKKLALPRILAEQIVEQCPPGEPLKMYEDHFVTKANERVVLYSNAFDASEMMNMPQFSERYSDNKISPPVPVPDGLTAALERAMLLAGGEEPTVQLATKGKLLKFSADFKLGSVEEEFELSKAAATATISVDAKTLASVKDIKKLAIFPTQALSLHGDNGYMFMLTAKETPKAKKSSSEEKPKGRGKGKNKDEDPPWEEGEGDGGDD